jgi:hypothetical protein
MNERLIALKAAGYDLLALIQEANKKLDAVNAEIISIVQQQSAQQEEAKEKK